MLSSAPGLQAQSALASLDDRSKALAEVLRDYREDTLKHNPELASALGDERYSDQTSNYSAETVNDRLARGQTLLLRLAAIDATGFTDAETESQNTLMRRLEEDQKTADLKEWETPLAAQGGIYSIYPRLASGLSFTTAKDYDDWTARLHALPEAFSQVETNLSIGIDDRQVAPKAVVDGALEQVTAQASRKPEDSPLAAPLKRIPAGISTAEQERIKSEMLEAITKSALPAYMRFERFLKASYLPAAEKAQASAASAGSREQRILAAVLDLRAKAEAALGAKFDLKAFRGEVLGAYPLPVDRFEERVSAWIEKQGLVTGQVH